MELLREVIRRSAVTAIHCVIEQRSQRARSVRRYATESLERVPRVFAIFRVFGTNLKCCEIELIEVVLWFFVYRSSELLLLLGKIAFCAGQPTSNDMKGCAVPISGRDSIERVAGDIELSKAERGRSKI